MSYYDIYKPRITYTYECEKCGNKETWFARKSEDACCKICGSDLIEDIINVDGAPAHWNRNWVYQQVIIPMYKKGYTWEEIEREIVIQKQMCHWRSDGTYHITDLAKTLVRWHCHKRDDD